MSDALFDPAFTDTLGWTLIHFLWEGTVLTLLLYLFMGFTRDSRARYGAGVVIIAFMSASPVITFFSLLAGDHSHADPSQLQAVVSSLKTVASSAAGIPVAAQSLLSTDWLAYCVVAWLAGVTVFALRALGGYLVLRRLVREKCEPLAADLRALCARLQEKLGVTRTVRYVHSHLVQAPAVVGWFRPAVLIPVSALAGLSPSQLEAVIAHELAHIRRLDCFVNLFQIAVETILFYHPAVWWVNRQIRIERENCCDDVAVMVSGDSLTYARALVLMEDCRHTPQMALAANSGSLKHRVSRILGLDVMTRSVPQAGLAIVGCLFVVGVILSAAAFGKAFAYEAQADPARPAIQEQQEPELAPTAPVVPFVPQTDAIPSAPKANLHIRVRPKVQVDVESPVKLTVPENVNVEVAVATPLPPLPPIAFEEAMDLQDDEKGSYIEDLRSAGLQNLSVDDLIALKVQRVSPDYVRAMRAAGFDASVGDLIAMKVQGVSPDYVKRLRAAGLKDLSVGKVVALKVQRIDPAQAGEFKRELGLTDDLSIGQIVAFKVQGITPEYVRDLRAAGLKDLSTGQIIAAKVQGISPEFVRKVRDHGFNNLTIDQLIRLKITGVF